MFDQIEKLKQDLTDQYVVVNTGVPELKRFDGYVGQVKTVNMNGRALVQFEAWANIGWYDIDVDYLKVVPKPEAGAAEKKHEKPTPAAKAAKPAATGEKKLSPLEMARMQDAAAVRNRPPGAAKPAAAKTAAKPAAPAAGGKKSTAEILAAARAKVTQAAAPVEESASEEPVAQEAAEEAVPAPAAVAAKPKAAAKPAFTPGQRPSVPEILAWCREHDTK